MSASMYKYLLISLCSVLVSCTSNTVYHHYNRINDNGWKKTDTIYFILHDSIEEGTYATKIGIRHTIEYPYRDLWLSISLPNKKETDTIHINLANERGNWNGSGTASGYYQYETEGPTLNYKLHSDSIIKVWHIMKGGTVQSITDLGIKLTKNNIIH